MNNKQQTAMQELLAQLKEERNNLPIPKEWANCLRSIEIVIEKHYLDKEKEHIKDAWNHGFDWGMMEESLAEQGEPSTLIDANHYYKETYDN